MTVQKGVGQVGSMTDRRRGSANLYKIDLREEDSHSPSEEDFRSGRFKPSPIKEGESKMLNRYLEASKNRGKKLTKALTSKHDLTLHTSQSRKLDSDDSSLVLNIVTPPKKIVSKKKKKKATTISQTSGALRKNIARGNDTQRDKRKVSPNNPYRVVAHNCFLDKDEKQNIYSPVYRTSINSTA